MDERRARWQRSFTLVDASFCFLAKHRAVLSVRNVLNMVHSLDTTYSMTVNELRELTRVAPHLIKLQSAKEDSVQHKDDMFRQPEDVPQETTVVSFPTIPHPSKRASTKRLKQFKQALEQYKDPPQQDEITEPAVKSTQLLPPVANDYLEILWYADFYDNQITFAKQIEGREGRYRDITELKLSPVLAESLHAKGIDRIYSHQFQAIHSLLYDGDNVALATSTASGKSLTYTVHMLSTLLADDQATFLYLFPTKALAQDQLQATRSYLESVHLPLHLAETFDGDTPMRERRQVIQDTRVFFSNPDMLHLSILPNHKQWKRMLSHLKLVVIDEAHMYHGIFGSHVSLVLRRLFRLCAYYGSNPQVITCSATIPNVSDHFKSLLPTLPSPDDALPSHFDFFRQRNLREITKDGSPTASKCFCLWNPKQRSEASETKEDETDKTRVSISPIYQTSLLLTALIKKQVATLVFCRGRKVAELVLINAHANLRGKDKALRKMIACYRGGYSTFDRRRIEQKLWNNELRGVVSTNALEVGVDIQQMDVTVHLGLPSSISSLYQQAGRAGRRKGQGKTSSLAVIVCFDSPLDQYFAKHGDELFHQSPESVVLNPTNPQVLEQHLLCAAKELALFSKSSGTQIIDSYVFDKPFKVVDKLVREKKLMKGDEEWRVHYAVRKGDYIVNLRSISDINYKVVTDDSYQQEIDTIAGDRAFFQVYPTAVYLHQAKEYLITKLDVSTRTAYAKLVTTPLQYFTSCRDYTDLNVLHIQHTKRYTDSTGDDLLVQKGIIGVTTQVFGSFLLEKKSMKVLQTNEFALPPIEMTAEGLWFEFPQSLRDRVEKERKLDWKGSLHGAGHLAAEVVQLFVKCSSSDINTQHYHPLEKRQSSNRLTLYEAREGGSGIIPFLLQILPQLIDRIWTIANECDCTYGCPACFQSVSCPEFNVVLDKQGALVVLDYLKKRFAYADGQPPLPT